MLADDANPQHYHLQLLFTQIMRHAEVVDGADTLRRRLQQSMQQEHQATSAVRAANRRAEGQLLQARQVGSDFVGAACQHQHFTSSSLKPLTAECCILLSQHVVKSGM